MPCSAATPPLYLKYHKKSTTFRSFPTLKAGHNIPEMSSRGVQQRGTRFPRPRKAGEPIEQNIDTILRQTENRRHAQNGVLVFLLG